MHETNELRSILNQELLPLLEQLDEFERQMPRTRPGSASTQADAELRPPAFEAIARQRDEIDGCVKELMQQLYPSPVEGTSACETDEALRRILGVSQRIQETASTILHRYEEPADESA